MKSYIEEKLFVAASALSLGFTYKASAKFLKDRTRPKIYNRTPVTNFDSTLGRHQQIPF